SAELVATDIGRWPPACDDRLGVGRARVEAIAGGKDRLVALLLGREPLIGGREEDFWVPAEAPEPVVCALEAQPAPAGRGLLELHAALGREALRGSSLAGEAQQRVDPIERAL